MKHLTQNAVAKALGREPLDLFELCRTSPHFPRPTGSDGHGNFTWSADAINSFLSLHASARLAGYKVAPWVARFFQPA